MSASQVGFYKMLMLITAGSGVSFGVLFISRNNASFLSPPLSSLFPLRWLRAEELTSKTRARSLPPAADFFHSDRHLPPLVESVSRRFGCRSDFFFTKKISRTFHHTTGNYHFLKIKPLAIQKASALYLYICEVKRRIAVILFLSRPSCCPTLSLAAPALGSISNPFCGPCADFRCDLM